MRHPQPRNAHRPRGCPRAARWCRRRRARRRRTARAARAAARRDRRDRRRVAASAPAARSASASGAASARHRPESSLPSLVSGVSSAELRKGRRRARPQRRRRRVERRDSAASGTTRSGRPLTAAGSNSACGPLPTNSERTKIGGARSSARAQRARVEVRGPARRRTPRPRGASSASVVPAAAAIAARSAAASGFEAGAAVGDERRVHAGHDGGARGRGADQLGPVRSEVGERVAGVPGEAGDRLAPRTARRRSPARSPRPRPRTAARGGSRRARATSRTGARGVVRNGGRGGERERDVAAAVAVVRAGAADAGGGARRDAPQLAMVERRVGGEHDDDRALVALRRVARGSRAASRSAEHGAERPSGDASASRGGRNSRAPARRA